jgi:hypothetical protein
MISRRAPKAYWRALTDIFKIRGELGELYAEIRFGVLRHPPGTQGYLKGFAAIFGAPLPSPAICDNSLVLLASSQFFRHSGEGAFWSLELQNGE